MKVNFPDKHAQIVRMGTKNSEQKGAAKVVSHEVETQYGRRHIIRMGEILNNGMCAGNSHMVSTVIDIVLNNI